MPQPFQTFLSYNGVVATPIRTLAVDEVPIFSDDKIDYLYTLVTIRIAFLYNPTQTSYLVNGGLPVKTAGLLPSITEKSIRHFLMQPKKQLIWQNGGNPIVTSPAAGFAVDANNGPMPIECRVVRIDGHSTFHVQYAIQTWVIECPTGSSTSAIISNRYSQTSSINDLHYTTLMTQGRAYFRTDILSSAGVVADSFRSRLFPQAPPGFKRQKITVNVATTANVIDYSVEDQELPYDLGETDPRNNGSGIDRINATYSVSSLGTEGGIASPMAASAINIEVFGNKYAHNWILLQAAVQLANQRLPIVDFPRNGVMIRNVAFTEWLTDRHITLNIVFQSIVDLPFKAGLGIAPVAAIRLGNPFADQGGDQPSMPNDGGSRGTAEFQNLSSLITNACLGVKPPGCVGPSDGSGVLDVNCGPPPAIQVTFVEVLPNNPKGYSTTQTSGQPYTSSHSRIRIKRKNGTKQLPRSNPKQPPTNPYPYTPAPPYQRSSPGDPTTYSSSVIQLHSPLTMAIVDWESERLNYFPSVPNPVIADPNFSLIEHEIHVPSFETMPDGSNVAFKASGSYSYALQDDPGPKILLSLMSLPWMENNFGDFNINDNIYENGLIDSLDGSIPIIAGDNIGNSNTGGSPGNSGGNS